MPLGLRRERRPRHYLQRPWLWSWTNAAAGTPSRDGLRGRLALDPEQSNKWQQEALLHLAVAQHAYVSTRLSPGLWALAHRSSTSWSWTEIREIGKRLAVEGYHKYAKGKLHTAPAGPVPAPAPASGPVPVEIGYPQGTDPPFRRDADRCDRFVNLSRQNNKT